MATTARIEHAVTITQGKVCVFESDLTVNASVHEDGEVLIDDISMTQVVKAQVHPNDPRAYRVERVATPMTDSSNPHMVRLSMWVQEELLADPDFVAKARDAADEINAGSVAFRQRLTREMERA